MSNLLSNSFPDRARISCRQLQAQKASLPAWTDGEAVVKFAESLDVPKVIEIGSSLANDQNATGMDLSKAGGGEIDAKCLQQLEAGLIVLMHALDFGGGWRQELHAFHQKGAFATVKPGVEKIFADCPQLTADYLEGLTELQVAQAFGLVLKDDDAAATSMTIPPTLAPFVQGLTRVCQEVGQGVRQAGFANVGDWITAKVNQAPKEAPAAQLVQDLVETFPYTFKDVHNIALSSDTSTTVYLYKKAQLVVGELGYRFQGEVDSYRFADLANLTAFIDNVIVAVLRKFGVVATTTALEQAIETHQALPSGSLEEVSLRAAAMTGVEDVCAHINDKAGAQTLSPSQLGNYLWGYLGKQPDHRKYQRHATKDTVFY